MTNLEKIDIYTDDLEAVLEDLQCCSPRTTISELFDLYDRLSFIQDQLFLCFTIAHGSQQRDQRVAVSMAMVQLQRDKYKRKAALIEDGSRLFDMKATAVMAISGRLFNQSVSGDIDF